MTMMSIAVDRGIRIFPPLLSIVFDKDPIHRMRSTAKTKILKKKDKIRDPSLFQLLKMQIKTIWKLIEIMASLDKSMKKIIHTRN
jgi:hypothetical protein